MKMPPKPTVATSLLIAARNVFDSDESKRWKLRELNKISMLLRRSGSLEEWKVVAGMRRGLINERLSYHPLETPAWWTE